MASEQKTLASPSKDGPITVLPKEENKVDLTAAVVFLLDREMRRDVVNGRASRAKIARDLIHSLGAKTATEKEEEAEALRVASLAPANEPLD